MLANSMYVVAIAPLEKVCAGEYALLSVVRSAWKRVTRNTRDDLRHVERRTCKAEDNDCRFSTCIARDALRETVCGRLSAVVDGNVVDVEVGRSPF